ncbi:MAG: sigma-54-dependent Fis family transcriptional regulator [Deltaproteobacteria bacterium]|nr:sigma-54-dependent Fis family transcriptional regulator [Deltaproteobacteria bacterium]
MPASTVAIRTVATAVEGAVALAPGVVSEDPVEARRAAERLAAAGDHEAAALLLRGALGRAPAAPAFELRLDLAQALGRLGRHGEAAEVLRPDLEGRCAENRLALAEARRLAGDLAGAREALEHSRSRDGAAFVRERERQEAECGLLEGDVAGARGTAERLLGAAALPGAERIRILDLLGRASWAQSDWTDASARFSEVRKGAAALGDSRQEVRAAINESVCRMKLGATEDAARGFRDAVYLAAVLGLRREEAIAAQNLAWLEHMRRRYGPALEHYRHALGLLDAVGNPEYLARHVHNLGELMLRLGDPVGAREQLDYARGVAARQAVVSPALRGEAALLRARIALASGRTAEAAEALDEARGIYAAAPEPERAAELAVLDADRLSRDGRFAEAHDLVRGRTPLLSRFPKHHAEALLVAADCLAARGSDPRASLERALELARTLRDDEIVWRAQFRLARHLHDLHRTVEAQRALAAARKVDDRLLESVPAELAGRMERMPERAAMRALVRQIEAAGSCAPADSPAAPAERPETLVARSAAFRGLLERARCVARSEATVLVVGETGAGKDRVARFIHEQSDRRGGPFVKVSCGAAVEDLFLTDLLGHERGAFTGAVERRAGWFEAAAGGTLFLDEIAETTPRTQALILRVLEERRLVRVGGLEPVAVDVRVICATNRPLDELVERGAFRADLYYHLRGMRLEVPPLRERPEDVEGIAGAVLARAGTGRSLRLTQEALVALRGHCWPGNARELENVVLAAAALSAGPAIDAADLVRHGGLGGSRGPSAQAREAAAELAAELDLVLAGRRPLGEVLAALETRVVASAWDRCAGNLAAAARMVGLPRARVAQAVRRLGFRAVRSKDEVKS